MMHAICYVMAKAPVAGAVKTRLCPPLSAAQAAALADAFASDTLARLAALQGLDVRLALDRPADGCAMIELASSLGIGREMQGEGDLGRRMARLVERGLAGGLPVILVGTDSPDLPGEIVESAIGALGRVDVVLAPARDGGYVLVGARRRVEGLFEIDAPWSSPRVFAATCESLGRRGCAFEILAPWDDVDDAAALGRLAARLDDRDPAAAPATARLLDVWRNQGVRF